VHAHLLRAAGESDVAAVEPASASASGTGPSA
jgi:AhpD family alkylhydroperoxidase